MSPLFVSNFNTFQRIGIVLQPSKSLQNTIEKPWRSETGTTFECCTLGNMNKMAAPTGQHGKYLLWLQLLNRLSDFHTVFTDDLRKKSSLFPDQGDWCQVAAGVGDKR